MEIFLYVYLVALLIYVVFQDFRIQENANRVKSHNELISNIYTDQALLEGRFDNLWKLVRKKSTTKKKSKDS